MSDPKEKHEHGSDKSEEGKPKDKPYVGTDDPTGDEDPGGGATSGPPDKPGEGE